MDTRQIRHFLAVVEHRNVLRAAEAIHISQPALTRSIHNLEAELDVPLFTRGPRGMAPTIYGDLLLQHARLLQNQGQQAASEIRALKAGRVGHLRLGVANFAITFLPRVLARLVSTTPGLSFEIVDGTYERLTSLVREGALDALAAGFPPVHRAEDLVHEELVAGEFLILCHPDHPLAAQPQPSLAAAAKQRWILADRPRAVSELMEMIFRDGGVRPPEPLITSGSMTYLKAVLLEGEFVTSLPRGLVARELETGELVALPFVHGAVSTVEGIIYRAEAVHPPALFLLIEAIKAQNAAPTSGFGVRATFGRRPATRGAAKTPRRKRR